MSNKLGAIHTRSGNDALISIGDVATGSILIAGQYNTNGFDAITRVIFSDGNVLTDADLVRLTTVYGTVATVSGTAASETLTGTTANNVLDGGAGDDILRGGAGSDNYLFGPGSGNDIIEESGNSANSNADILSLGVAPDDVEATRSGRDVILKILSTGEQVTLRNQYLINNTQTSYPINAIEFVSFSDGAVWNAATISANAWYRGTAANNTLNGTNANDTLQGRGGDDLLEGGSGSDTFVYAVGDGNDTLRESDQVGDTDTLRLQGISLEDIVFSIGTSTTLNTISSPYDLRITFKNTTGSIFIDNFFSTFSTVNGASLERIVLDDGTNLDGAAITARASVRGTEGNDILTAAFDTGSGIILPGKVNRTGFAGDLQPD